MKPLIWKYHIPLFSSFIWGNIAKGFSITIGILTVFFFILGWTTNVSLPQPSDDMVFAGGFIGIVIFFTLFIFIILFWNGFDVEYRVDKSGLFQKVTGMSSKVHTWTILLGLLGRSRSAVGAGLLAQGGEERFISWKELKYIKVDKTRKYFYASRAFLGIYPIDMFCGTYFTRVLNVIQKHTDTTITI